MKLDEWTKRYLAPESLIITFLGKYADLIVLNILWIVCSLPIFSMGAASTALYKGVASIRRNEGTPARLFLAAFRSSFKAATKVFFICMALSGIVMGLLFLASSMTGLVRMAMLSFGICGGFVLLFWTSFLFPIMAVHDFPLKRQMKLALFTALGNLGIAMGMGALNLTPMVILVVFFYPGAYTLPGWILFGFSLIAICNSWLCDKALARIPGMEVTDKNF